MALATQCPHCYTSFRVANDQLKLHAGMVRCGACKQTFNGIEHLLAPGEAPRTPPPKQEDVALLDNEASRQTQLVDEEQITQAEAEPAGTTVSNDEQSSTTSTSAETLDAATESKINFEDSLDQEPEHSSNVAAEPENAEIDATINTSDEAAENLTQSVAQPSQISSEAIENSLLDPSVSDAAKLNESVDLADSSAEHLATDSAQQDFEELAQADSDNALSQESVEEAASQQELDDIALFQEKLASFAAMVEATPQSEAEQTPTAVPETAEDFAAQLELIEQEPDHEPATHNIPDEVTPATPASIERETVRNQAPTSLSANIDFELSEEERAWQELAELSKLEVETKAAVSAVDENTYSRHEPHFSDDSVIDDELEQNLQSLLNVPEPQSAPSKLNSVTTNKQEPLREEPSESITDHAPTPEALDEETPEFMLQAERAHRFGKWQIAGLVFGIIILFSTATIQGVYLMRSSIAAQYPSSKPQLLKLCAQLGCELKLPTQIEHIVVEGTELSTLSQEPHLLQLSALFRNKSSTIQAWPMLELVLKDSRNRPVLQRVFKPEEYLENRDQIGRGFAANSDTTIKLHFELSTSKAANYAVEVFYP